MADRVSLMDFMVVVGSQSFEMSADWPGYIGQQLNAGIDASATGVQRAARTHLTNVSKYVEHFHGSKPWNGRLKNDSNRLQRRSGGTIERFKASQRVSATGNGLDKVDAQMNVGVFGIHLTGGVVSARRSRYLTIPLPAACDRRGVPLKRRARDWPNTFVITSKSGNPLIVHKVGGRIVPLYVLKPSVRIPPRLIDLPKVWDGYVNRYEIALVTEIERAIDSIKW